MAKFCANCGKELIPGKPFCPDCGYSSNAAPEQDAAPVHHLSAPEPQSPQNSTVPQSTVPQDSNEPSPKQPMIRAQQFIQQPMAQPPQMPAQMPSQLPPSQLPPSQLPSAQLPSQPQMPQNFQAPPDPFASQSQPPALNIQQPDTQPPKEQPQKKTGCLDSPLLTAFIVFLAVIMAVELIVAALWYPGFFIRP